MSIIKTSIIIITIIIIIIITICIIKAFSQLWSPEGCVRAVLACLCGSKGRRPISDKLSD